MNTIILLSAIVASVLAGPCRHDAQTEWTEARVIDLVAEHMNTDKDNFISELDLAIEFVLKYDTNFRNGVEEHEFITRWTQTYHDEKALALHVFQHLDVNNPGNLDTKDIAPLLKRVDADGDGKISVTEFKLYLKQIYNAC